MASTLSLESSDSLGTGACKSASHHLSIINFANQYMGVRPLSWTSPRSFVPFVHHVITTLPPSQLENRIFEIEGDRKSFREIIALWEAKHERRAEVTERSPEEIQKYLEEHPDPFFKFIKHVFTAHGEMLISGKDNKVWPEWKPLTWEDMLP